MNRSTQCIVARVCCGAMLLVISAARAEPRSLIECQQLLAARTTSVEKQMITAYTRLIDTISVDDLERISESSDPFFLSTEGSSQRIHVVAALEVLRKQAMAAANPDLVRNAMLEVVRRSLQPKREVADKGRSQIQNRHQLVAPFKMVFAADRPNNVIDGYAVAPSGDLLFVSATDRADWTNTILNLETGRSLTVENPFPKMSVSHPRFSADGRWLSAVVFNQSFEKPKSAICVWNAATGKLEWSRVYKDGLPKIEIQPIDSERVLVLDYDLDPKIYEIGRPGPFSRPLKTPDDAFELKSATGNRAFHPDLSLTQGTLMLASLYGDLWKWDYGANRPPVRLVDGSPEIDSVSLSEDGKMFLRWHRDGSNSAFADGKPFDMKAAGYPTFPQERRGIVSPRSNYVMVQGMEGVWIHQPGITHSPLFLPHSGEAKFSHDETQLFIAIGATLRVYDLGVMAASQE